MKPGIFDERDDLNHPLNQDDLGGRLNLQEYQNAQVDGRERIWKWRREQWEKCCKLGPGHIFAFNLPRRCGKTRMAHHIASKGFSPKTKILVVCTGERMRHFFQEMGGNFSTETKPPSINKEWDVIIFDEVNFIIPPEEIQALYQKATVFLFGSDIGDYPADYYGIYMIKE